MLDWMGNWIGALVRSWGKQMHLPLADSLKKRCRKSSRSYEMAGFPLLGALCALIIFLISSLAGAVFNNWGGALLFALGGWLFMLFHDYGRGDGLITSALTEILPGENIPYRYVLPAALMILKFAMLMLLFFSGRGFLLTLIFAGVFAMEALMLKEADPSWVNMTFDESASRRFWTVMVLILLCNFAVFALGSALAALFFVLWRKMISEKRVKENCTPDAVRLDGAVFYFLGLLAGIFMI